MSFCTNCGAHIEEGSKFCVNCGTPVVDTAEKKVEEVKEEIPVLSSELIDPTPNNQKPSLNGEYIDASVPASAPVSAPTEKKCWSIFAKTGFGLGLTGFIVSFIPIIGLYGLLFAVPGLVLSILGKKSNAYARKAKSGLVFSILGIIFSIVFYVIVMAIIVGAGGSALGDILEEIFEEIEYSI